MAGDSNQTRPARPSTGYLPALDGLRAVAVLSVLLYHLEPAVLPGGFVGVDIFFVLSGYLITRIIDHDLRAGTFSLWRFYQRRIARIAPALFVMCAVVMAVAAGVYTETDFAGVGSSAAATAASILNLKLIFQDNYFLLSPDTLPLLHCWSLSVEEQFYLCYPVLCWLVYRWRPSLLFPAVGVLTVLSAAACIALTPSRPNWAFYLPLTRAWELGAGGLVALWSAAGGRGGRAAVRSACGWGGLALLAASIAWTPGGTSFPGAWALLPVAGAVLVVVAQQRVAADESQRVTGVLASPPLIAIGRISYSLYLWHWPVFTFVDYLLPLTTPVTRMVLKVALTILCSCISYGGIESPLRTRLARPAAGRVAYAAFFIGVIALCAIGYEVRVMFNLNGRVDLARRGGVRYGVGEPVTVLAGDSTACMFGTTVRTLCREGGGALVIAAVPGLNPLPDPSAGGETLWSLTEAILARERPTCVILSARWASILTSPADRERLGVCLSKMLAHADRVIVLQQPPILPFEATREGMRRGCRPPFHEHHDDSERRRKANEILRSFASERVRVIDVDRQLLDETGAIRRWDSRGNDLFLDPTHVSAAGAHLLAPDLRAAMSEAP
jgi:peptidoglycan/LPS O-acetylase OafA/YrhL